MNAIYENVFNRTLDNEKARLGAVQRQLRLLYEELLIEEGEPENTEKRQRAIDRLKASRLHADYQRLCDELEAEENRQDELLNKLAPKISFQLHETMYLLREIMLDTPCPPGTNPSTYLEPTQEMLDYHGFSSHVRTTDRSYELWANCPPWMMDAIHRRYHEVS